MKQGMGHRMSHQVPELSPMREQDHASLLWPGDIIVSNDSQVKYVSTQRSLGKERYACLYSFL